jgi:hypothetical protein
MLKQTRSSVCQKTTRLTVEMVVLENVQVLETEEPSLNRETTALSSNHMMVEPCLNRETIAINSNPRRTHLISQIQSATSANTQGTQ